MTKHIMKTKKTKLIVSTVLVLIGAVLVVITNYLADQDSQDSLGPNIGLGLLYISGIILVIIGTIYLLFSYLKK